MPDETITEEQKQLKRLLKRWYDADSMAHTFVRCLPHFLLTIIASSLLMVLLKMNNPLFSFFLFAFLPAELYLFFVFFRYLNKREQFLKQLTDEEKVLLEHASQVAPKREQGASLALLKAYQQVSFKGGPQKELLRASTESQDDTLLRAAQYTEEKAQEQLLRPTDEP